MYLSKWIPPPNPKITKTLDLRQKIQENLDLLHKIQVVVDKHGDFT